jgi:hypothetical protein
MDGYTFTCDDCGKDFAHEDDGYVSEAGFECCECYTARWVAERDAYLASSDYQIQRNYPDLDRNVAMSRADPVGFYLACKGDPGSLDRPV